MSAAAATALPTATALTPDSAPSAWSALRNPLYRAVWVATFVSSVGTRFDDVAGAWLMTSLAPSPLMVSLVQAAASVPVFLLAVPAGALSDVLDRRRMLIASQAWTALAAGTLAALTIFGHVTPYWLLALELAVGIGTALSGPAWQAIVPELVSPRDLQSAVTLNSVSVNLARTVGPALAGMAVAAVGAGYGFLANAVSFLGVIGVLLSWKRPVAVSVAPAERFAGSVRAGLRYVRHSAAVQAVLFRNALFISGASALWALMPVVARQELHREATGYGVLLGCLGVGALIGASVLPGLRNRFGAGGVVLAGTLVFAAAELTLAHVKSFPVVCAVLFPAGAAWVSVLSTLNVTAQGSVPGWVRGRALSMYLLTWFGGMAAGSAAWGWVATHHSIPAALSAAAGYTLVLGVVGAAVGRLPRIARDDLSPSRHWPDPELLLTPEHDEGPVLITVAYRVSDANAPRFLELIHRHSKQRLRDGAYRWGIFRDAADPQTYLETFVVESWGEHLRQHERVTERDRRTEEEINALTEGGVARAVGHYLYAAPRAEA